MKKISLILLLVFLLSVSSLGIISLNAQTTPLSITSTESVYVAPNAEFSIDVKAGGATNLVGFQLKLDYDETQFTFDSITDGSLLGNSITVNSTVAGEILLNYVDISKVLSGDIVLFTLTFTANNNVSKGEQVIVSEDSSYNNEFISMDSSYNITKFTSVTYGFNNVKHGLFGDVNLDNSISILDVALIQLKIANKATFTETKTVLSDINGDGSISVIDAGMIQLYLAGLRTTLDPS